MVSSFDIFDTCVVRKCGAPRNLFDVLSYRVFYKEVSEEHRIEFITQRAAADDSSSFDHLYNTFDYFHPFLLPQNEIMQKELNCEREMMVPVKSMLEEVNKCRQRGDHIIFISDMYLPTSFIQTALSELGFFKGEDSIYISGDTGLTKHDGSLYKWVKEKEEIEFVNWQHYGDNIVSDIQIPSNLGITVHPVNHCYLPYEDAWIASSNNLTFHTGGIMAGIGRSIYHSIEEHPHNAFAIDITAPFTVSFTLRIMNDAAKRGIQELYFCSRDCYAMYHVAKKLERIVPKVKAHYYTSREALYNTQEEELISYLTSIGLAQTDNIVGIVDIRSSGKSLKYTNHLLEKHGYKSVFGYYFEMYCMNSFIKDVPPYYCEINTQFCNLSTIHHQLIERFISICPEGRTVGYRDNQPILSASNENEDSFIDNIDTLSEVNLSILERYADCVIETELYRHISEVFLSFVIQTIRRFFSSPDKEYLLSLPLFHILQEDGSYAPYIEKKNKNIAYHIAFLAQTSNTRMTRRSMKLLMRAFRIPPIRIDDWWPEGTKVYNS